MWQCAEAGLVDGSKIFLDSSLIEADAAKSSVIDTQSLKRHLSERYRELEKRLSEREREEENAGEPPSEDRPYRDVNARFVSTTDPDAAIVRRGDLNLCYQTHRAVDGQHEIITAAAVTPGDVNEAHLLTPLVEAHRDNTGRSAAVVVADSKYGTIENFLACHDRGLRAHVPDMGAAAARRRAARQMFTESAFAYDPVSDTYRCPAGKPLRRTALDRKRHRVEYTASRTDCATCPLRPQCTRDVAGRTIRRHLRQDALDRMRAFSRTPRAKRDLRIRHHLMERSFAQSTRYGFDRARWRGLWRVQIQEYLICTIQNLQTLIRYGRNPRKWAAGVLWPDEARGYPLLRAIGAAFFTLLMGRWDDRVTLTIQYV